MKSQEQQIWRPRLSKKHLKKTHTGLFDLVSHWDWCSLSKGPAESPCYPPPLTRRTGPPSTCSHVCGVGGGSCLLNALGSRRVGGVLWTGDIAGDWCLWGLFVFVPMSEIRLWEESCSSRMFGKLSRTLRGKYYFLLTYCISTHLSAYFPVCTMQIFDLFRAWFCDKNYAL